MDTGGIGLGTSYFGNNNSGNNNFGNNNGSPGPTGPFSHGPSTNDSNFDESRNVYHDDCYSCPLHRIQAAKREYAHASSSANRFSVKINNNDYRVIYAEGGFEYYRVQPLQGQSPFATKLYLMETTEIAKEYKYHMHKGNSLLYSHDCPLFVANREIAFRECLTAKSAWGTAHGDVLYYTHLNNTGRR